MADATPAEGGTSSTPPPAEPAGDPPSTPPPVAEPVKAAAEPVKATEPAAEPVEAPEPLFTLPEDFKPPESMVAKFTEFAKGLPDKKLAQGIADLYVGMAREATKGWEAQIAKLDAENKTACQQRFSPEELTAAETAVGFFSSYEPAFRDLAKRQLNDPVFTNAMRLVGELLSEDDLGKPTPPPPPKDTRTLRERAQEKLYGGKPS